MSGNLTPPTAEQQRYRLEPIRPPLWKRPGVILATVVTVVAAVVWIVGLAVSSDDPPPTCADIDAAVDDYNAGDMTEAEFVDTLGADSRADAERILQGCKDLMKLVWTVTGLAVVAGLVVAGLAVIGNVLTDAATRQRVDLSEG